MYYRLLEEIVYPTHHTHLWGSYNLRRVYYFILCIHLIFETESYVDQASLEVSR